MTSYQSDLDIEMLYRDADRIARRALRRGHLPAMEREDLRQELMLDLLSRLRHFDPARGSIGAFAQVCFRHRVQRAVWVQRREARDRHLFSCMGEHVATGFHDPAGSLMLRLDLGHTLSLLSPAQRVLVMDLLQPAGMGAAAPRTTRHRHLQAVRAQLSAAGLKEAA
ncbi:sigma factor [Pseudoroseomonas sp. WGS1072]|uniref:sigma factor n=1 Tax=Roseomonas sp. WGS1072 TaxID=3366816 RepID=UPI003BEFC706